MAAIELDAVTAGWHAALALDFRHAGDRTVLAARRHEGPFCVQRPFHPGDGVCHTYLLHPPGGLAGGDRLVLDARVAAGAATLLTTPAATKLYRSDGAPSVVVQSLRVERGASLEWLPLETMLFGGSRARIETEIELDTEARFIGWEVTALGRPLSGDRYATGTLDQRTRVLAGGAVLLEERLRLCAGERLLTAPWGLAGFKVCGTLYAYPAGPTALERVRARLPGRSREAAAAATRLGPLLVVRCLAQQVERVREIFESLWAELRPLLLARPPSAPRIWQT